MIAKPLPHWDELFYRKDGWSGADGIYAFVHHGRLLFYFSDTILSRPGPNNQRKGFRLAHNSFASMDLNGQNASFITHFPACIEADSGYYWLQDGLIKKEALYVYALRVEDSKTARIPFLLKGTDLLKIQLPLKESPSFEVIDSRLDEDLYFGSALIRHGHYYYVFCYTGGARKRTILARTPSLDKPDYEFLQKDGRYSKNNHHPKVLCDFLPAESKIYFENNRYYIAYSPYGISQEVRLTSFTKLGEEIPPGECIYHCPEMKGEDITYNAKIQPALSSPARLVITYNVNSLSSKRVETTYLYRPHFLEVEL